MAGGTFTISNGGVFGSMMGTPIINQPQSAILGMHATKDRAVVVNGQIVIRPMMYVALTYDHRLIDGREAVTFLVKVKHKNSCVFLQLFFNALIIRSRSISKTLDACSLVFNFQR
jgi:pyruvate/2-oxoglutarate dehydrogenase complex dihydrolipoamide acyltransferase (E2) component